MFRQWDYIASWPDAGPALCADVNWMMPDRHPTRIHWSALLEEAGHSIVHQLATYFNSGFLGVHRRDLEFIRLWNIFLEKWGGNDNSLEGEGDIGQWRKGGRWLPFHTPDQDALNLSAMAWTEKLVTLGPDAMAFSGGWNLIPHAVGGSKPWRRRFIKEAITARGPKLVDKKYWENSLGTIEAHSRSEVARQLRAIQVASFLCRFMRRS